MFWSSINICFIVCEGVFLLIGSCLEKYCITKAFLQVMALLFSFKSFKTHNKLCVCGLNSY